MKIIKTALALAILSTSFSGGLALAQEHHDNDAQQHHDNDRDNHKYVKHDDWKKGSRIKQEDWDRGEHVDYKQNRLNAPPRGHEWRLVDGNYILVNSSNFQIHTVVVAR
jgi:Ni/Co efflux regulator RcnB